MDLGGQDRSAALGGRRVTPDARLLLAARSGLYLLMGTGFAKAYEIFSIGAAIVLLMLFSYGVFRSRLQKKRIFY